MAVWWLLSGNGPHGPAGSESQYAAPDGQVTPGTPTSAPTPTPTTPGAVRIDGYFVRDPLRVALSYRLGRDCSLATPRVLETEAAVTITLVRSPADDPAHCGGGAGRHTVLVLLDSPLDGRAILDGSTAPQVRVEQTSAGHE